VVQFAPTNEVGGRVLRPNYQQTPHQGTPVQLFKMAIYLLGGSLNKSTIISQT
jgi:hypothetical protein